ncbi:flagellar biosynthetic protein FliO [Caldicellulosiruptoraceae bacterium PP1]
MSEFIKLFFGILLFAIILYLSYFTSKYLSKKVSRRKGENIKIIETLPLSSDSLLILVEVFDKVLLLSRTQKNISILKEFDKKEINIKEEPFDNILKNNINNINISKSKMKDKIEKLYENFKDH